MRTRRGLYAAALTSADANYRAFFDALAGFGFEEGKNLVVERRVADGRIDRPDALAAELVAANVDAIFATADTGRARCQEGHERRPYRICDSARSGWGGSGVEPCSAGGNVTGVSTLGSVLVPKRTELLLVFEGSMALINRDLVLSLATATLRTASRAPRTSSTRSCRIEPTARPAERTTACETLGDQFM